MKINGKITLLFNSDGLHLEVRDEVAGIRFLEIYLDAEQTCQALGRLAYTKCKICDVYGLDKVGKNEERMEYVFKMPPSTYKDRQQIAYDEALRTCPEGWAPDHYFGARDSFFDKDGVEMARCTIRRWVDK
jgi:hypothetical protein